MDRRDGRREDGQVLHVVAAKPKPGGSVDNAEGEPGVIEKCPGNLPATDDLVQKAVGGFER